MPIGRIGEQPEAKDRDAGIFLEHAAPDVGGAAADDCRQLVKARIAVHAEELPLPRIVLDVREQPPEARLARKPRHRAQVVRHDVPGGIVPPVDSLERLDQASHEAFAKRLEGRHSAAGLHQVGERRFRPARRLHDFAEALVAPPRRLVAVDVEANAVKRRLLEFRRMGNEMFGTHVGVLPAEGNVLLRMETLRIDLDGGRRAVTGRNRPKRHQRRNRENEFSAFHHAVILFQACRGHPSANGFCGRPPQ